MSKTKLAIAIAVREELDNWSSRYEAMHGQEKGRGKEEKLGRLNSGQLQLLLRGELRRREAKGKSGFNSI